MSKILTRPRPKATSRKLALSPEPALRSPKRSRGGVVDFCVHGPGSSGKTVTSDFTPSKLIELLRVGLSIHELDALQACLKVPMDKLAPLLAISKATLHRRKSDGRLGPAESDRVVRFARLMGKAVEVLESEDNARRWLTSSQFGLGGEVPLDYARSEVGAREVEDLLGRIDHGVYS